MVGDSRGRRGWRNRLCARIAKHLVGGWRVIHRLLDAPQLRPETGPARRSAHPVAKPAHPAIRKKRPTRSYAAAREDMRWGGLYGEQNAIKKCHIRIDVTL